MHAVGIFILCLVATLSAGGLAGAHAEAPTTPVTSGADGSSSGLAAPGSQIWRQDIADVEGAAEGNDSLADALAAGDFNGDGESDLAIGVPLDDVGALEDAGAVNILYGSGSGLTVVGDQIWHQDVPDVEAGAEDFDQFGYALAAGDFNGDGRDDLAIGVPYEDVAIDTIPFVSFDAGAVNVLYGSGGGLSATGDQIWHQEVDGVESAAEVGDHFGYALTAGDFNGDGRDDLAIGVSDEDIELIDDAGAVSIIYGSGSGLTVTGDQIWHQDVDGIEGGAEDGDQFGSALTAGDFDGDGNDDLAIGVPSEAVEVLVAAGAVNVIEGSGSGLTASGGQIWHRDVAGVEGDASSGESFGHALAAGDFNGDGRADVAIGTDSGGRGDVNVLYGSIGGLSLEGDQIWDQDVANVEDIGEINDNFGSALAVGNFNNDAWDDLAIGVRYEDAESIENAGAVNVLHGSGGGLTAAGDQFWNQGVDGVADVPETNDYFGWALASGDFSGDGRDDLAIGVPNEDGTMAEDAGAVQVIYGAAASLPTPTFTGTPTPATAVTPAATHTPMPTTALTPAATHTATPTTAITPAATHTPTPTTASTPTATNAPTSTPTAPVPSPTATNTPITPVVTNTPTAPVPSPTRTRTSTPSLGEVGDADCNGAVNAIDAALILQLVAGLIGTVGCPANADVNSDGAVNAIDAALILQFTAGMLPDL